MLIVTRALKVLETFACTRNEVNDTVSIHAVDNPVPCDIQFCSTAPGQVVSLWLKG